MVKYLIDQNERRDVTMLYAARGPLDVAYRQVFEEARSKLDIGTTYVLSDVPQGASNPNTVKGVVTQTLIEQAVPDYMERTFYISGTHSMVEAMQENLLGLGVARRNIKTDFFPGYA